MRIAHRCSPILSALGWVLFCGVVGLGGCGNPKDGAPGAEADGGSADGGDGATDGEDGASDGGDGTADGGSEGGDGADGGTDGDSGSADWLDDEAALSALEVATAGLWYTSESDYPLDVVILADPGVELSADNATSTLAPAYSWREGTLPLEERAVDEVSLSVVFDRYTVEEEWWDDAMRADAERWRALRAVFEEQLGTPRAFRLGERASGGELFRDVDIFVLGRTSSGAWAGFRTVSIET
jgi:hypothetical protein